MSATSSETAIAIVGYGVMGQLVDKLAAGYGCRVAAVFDEDRPLRECRQWEEFDVAIDFSLPDAVVNNVRLLAAHRKAMVIGTTGWQAQQDEVRQLVLEAGVGCVVGSNFSIGMNMFFAIVRRAAILANRYDQYDVMMHEIHHRRKADSPSGTALSLAAILMQELDDKSELLTEAAQGPPAATVLHVGSTRGGDVPGTHTVLIDSEADTLELTHRARNRNGFAAGALRAARWIDGRSDYADFSRIFEEL